MKTVFKYSVPIDGADHLIKMHPRDRVVHVASAAPFVAGSNVYPVQLAVRVWVEHTVEIEDRQPRAFQVFGTGHPIDDEYMYVATLVEDKSVLVWHLYSRSELS